MSESLSVYIQRQLKRKGVTSKEAATAIGVTPTYFARVKKGKAKPGLEFCRKLAEFFGDSAVKVMRLAGLLPDTEADEVLMQEIRDLSYKDPRFREILEAYQSLTSEQAKEAFVAMARAALRSFEKDSS